MHLLRPEELTSVAMAGGELGGGALRLRTEGRQGRTLQTGAEVEDEQGPRTRTPRSIPNIGDKDAATVV
jgi:hypothetical protein